MMILALLLIVNLFPTPELKEIKVDDMGVQNALQAFIDSTDAVNIDSKVRYSIVAFMERRGASQLVYLGAVANIDNFKSGCIPSAYSEFHGKLVFWYDKKLETISFEEFRKQFYEGKKRNLWPDENFFAFDGRAFRCELRKGKILNSRRVCRFPDTNF